MYVNDCMITNHWYLILIGRDFVSNSILSSIVSIQYFGVIEVQEGTTSLKFSILFALAFQRSTFNSEKSNSSVAGSGNEPKISENFSEFLFPLFFLLFPVWFFFSWYV